MKHIAVIFLIVLIGYLYFRSYYEGFTPYGPYHIGDNQYQNAGGSAPARVNAISGSDQMKFNKHAQHVNPVPSGNPQNVYASLKRQP